MIEDDLIITASAVRHFGRLPSDERFPEKVRARQRTCFACGSKRHIIVGGMSVHKLESYEDKKEKKIYLIVRYAPFGCWLAHNKNIVAAFYRQKRDKDWLEEGLRK